MLGIIGGSGLDSLPNLTDIDRRQATTPYGAPSSSLAFGTLAGRDVVFVARHGDSHTIPPHLVNYRANLWAMREAGVEDIAAVFAVGGITDGMGPGTLVIPHQLIDYTHGREHTYADAIDQPVLHVDFTQPYTESVRDALLAAARRLSIRVVGRGIYGAVNGPRLETAAEIDRMERDGATIVGMTGMPEAGLARELGLNYAALAVSVNYAAGRGDSALQVVLDDIPIIMQRSMAVVCLLLEAWVREHEGTRGEQERDMRNHD